MLAEQEYFTRKELAEYLRVSLPTIDKWRAWYGLPCIVHGRVLRFKKSQVERWFLEGQIVFLINKHCRECKYTKSLQMVDGNFRNLLEDSADPGPQFTRKE